MANEKTQSRLCMFHPPKSGNQIKKQFRNQDLVQCHIVGIEGRVWVTVSELPDSAEVYAVEIVA